MVTFALVALVLVVSVRQSDGQDLSRYRGFQLGSDVVSVLGLAKADPSDAKTLHQRPAVLQNLQWRPRYVLAGLTTSLLDQREAPQREIEKRQQEAENARVSQEKARVANKAAFRP